MNGELRWWVSKFLYFQLSKIYSLAAKRLLSSRQAARQLLKRIFAKCLAASDIDERCQSFVLVLSDFEFWTWKILIAKILLFPI